MVVNPSWSPLDLLIFSGDILSLAGGLESFPITNVLARRSFRWSGPSNRKPASPLSPTVKPIPGRPAVALATMAMCNAGFTLIVALSVSCFRSTLAPSLMVSPKVSPPPTSKPRSTVTPGTTGTLNPTASGHIPFTPGRLSGSLTPASGLGTLMLIPAESTSNALDFFLKS